jgi:hypothetical protein
VKSAAKKPTKKLTKKLTKKPTKTPQKPIKAAPKARTKASAKDADEVMTGIGPRADYGAPVDGFFARQPPALRPLLDALRKLVDEAAPEASSALKWGMPFYDIGGNIVCALGAHKAHVNLILSGPPGTFDDPDGLLQGDGKTGRHLKLTSLAELPRAAVRAWLHTAAERARKPG